MPFTARNNFHSPALTNYCFFCSACCAAVAEDHNILIGDINFCFLQGVYKTFSVGIVSDKLTFNPVTALFNGDDIYGAGSFYFVTNTIKIPNDCLLMRHSDGKAIE